MHSASPPPMSDDTPWAQGFNDWLAFGNAANAFARGEEGFDAYQAGKLAARNQYRTRQWQGERS